MWWQSAEMTSTWLLWQRQTSSYCIMQSYRMGRNGNTGFYVIGIKIPFIPIFPVFLYYFKPETTLLLCESWVSEFKRLIICWTAEADLFLSLYTGVHYKCRECNTVMCVIAYYTLPGVRVLHAGDENAKISCCWPSLTGKNRRQW